MFTQLDVDLWLGGESWNLKTIQKWAVSQTPESIQAGQLYAEVAHPQANYSIDCHI